jgi:hypothetical protein
MKCQPKNKTKKQQTTTNRTIKIELAGDTYYGKTFPKIRLQGKWIEKLGFKPGGRVEIIPYAPGIVAMCYVEPDSQTRLALPSSQSTGTVETHIELPPVLPPTPITPLQLNESNDDLSSNPA